MKLWPFVVVVVGLVLGGNVYILVREPRSGAPDRPGWELPRLPLDRVAMPLPPRFAGPLPSRVEGFQQALEKGPPLSHVRSRLLEGDAEMGQKFLSSIQGALPARFEELLSTYGVALGLGDGNPRGSGRGPIWNSQDEGTPCEWLRAQLSSSAEQDVFLRELFFAKLARCPGAETEALFAQEDAPLFSALQQYFLFGGGRFTPALEQAVRTIVDQNHQLLFEEIAPSLSGRQEPAARELHERLWRQAAPEVAARLKDQAERIEQASRAEREHPPRCPSIPTRPDGIDQLVLSECLKRWAASDWASTARLAPFLSERTELLASEKAALATLRNFSSIDALKAWARERGLLPEAAAKRDDAPAKPNLLLSVMMREAGRAFDINLWDTGFPRQYDELLVTLAWKVRPELAGVAFEQLSPPRPPASWREEPAEQYTLRAYADGHRFSVQAQNRYAVHDIGAVLGLLNQVLESRGSTTRFAVMDSDFYLVGVVLGPEPALREADARGLWRLGDGQELLPRIEARLKETLRQYLGETPL